MTTAVVFDDSTGADTNIRGNRAVQGAGIDNTKTGIVCLGSDTGAVSSLGVTGNYASCVGGDMPSITGDYAVGGGYRPNARGMASTAFGYSSFADGEGCFASGRQNVAGRLPSDPLGEAKYATCMGASSFATGLASVALGGNNSATATGAIALGYNCAATDTGAVALGSGSSATANNSFATGAAQCSGVGGIAIGASNTTGDYAYSSGYGCTASDSYAYAQGLLCHATAAYARATGRFGVASRIAQMSHSGGIFSNPGDSQATLCYTCQATSTNGASILLTDLGGNDLALEDGKRYAIRATVLMARTDGGSPTDEAMFIHDILARCDGGTSVIANDNTALSAPCATGWTAVFAAAAGRRLTCTITGAAGQTVRGTVKYEWVEIGIAS